MKGDFSGNASTTLLSLSHYLTPHTVFRSSPAYFVISSEARDLSQLKVRFLAALGKTERRGECHPSTTNLSSRAQREI